MESLLAPSRITLGRTATDWKDAIRQSASLLEQDGITEARYVDAIFESFEKNSDYMIVIPEVVLSHARPEGGALSSGLSLMTLEQPVVYEPKPEKSIQVIFTLAATDSEKHIDVMQSLAEILVDEDSLQVIKTARDPQQIMALFDQVR